MRKADAIIALGGGISREGKLTNSSRSRIDMATALFRQGIAPHIITSGRWSYRLQTEPAMTEAAAMKLSAIEQGVPLNALYTEEFAMGTIANAYFIKRDILAHQKWHKLIITTCLLHAARTQMIFDHVLGDDYNIVVYPTLELPDKLSRQQADVRLTESTREIMSLPRGGDQALVSHFRYLDNFTGKAHSEAALALV